MLAPDHVNPFQWNEAMGIARQACARIFRDGGRPQDALSAFGIGASRAGEVKDWSKTVEVIAELLCREPVRRAA